MFKSYFKIALRNLMKHKAYSIINVLGLGIGMACVFLIFLFVREELSFDQFHENKDRIYRLNFSTTNPETGVETIRAIGPYRLAKELAVDFSDIPALIRFAPQGRELILHEGERTWEEGLCFVDPQVFEVFTFPLIKGDPAKVLNEPFSLVISEEIAEKYFDEKDPVGQTLRFQDHDFKITGVMRKTPDASQFPYNMYASMLAGPQLFSRIVLENWGEGYCETYAFLPEGMGPTDYTDRLSAFIDVKLEAWKRAFPKILMQPLPEIHLHSKNISTYIPGGDITYIYAFTAIALFILIIACINFMNLATARSANRAKEVGLRKVVGALRVQLTGQFLSESTLLAVLSFLLALTLSVVSLPLFNAISGKTMEIGVFYNAPLLAGLLAMSILVGLLAGFYPALFLSAFKPVVVLSGLAKRGVKGGWLRKGLVIFQFAVSIFLIVATAVVSRQLNYSRNIRIGFDKEQLVQLSGTPLSLRLQYEQFRAELVTHPNVINGGGSSRIPPERLRSSLTARPEGVPEDQWRGMQTIWADFDFIETMGFDIVTGRSFSREFATDAASAFILNEAAVNHIGWTNETAVGKAFGSMEIRDWDKGQWERKDGHVIGVLKEFHFESAHQMIKPVVYFIAPYMAWKYVIRIKPDNIPETLKFIESKWDQFVPDQPFVFQFVDENYDRLYRNEERQGQLFGAFAALAIFIACLGLVGLASFTAEQRTKEVGIRKVLGASIPQIMIMISREFSLLVVAAFVIAAPIAWHIMNGWLLEFAYHIRLSIWLFFFTGGLALIVTWITVGFQAAKVAMSDPVKTLRYE